MVRPCEEESCICSSGNSLVSSELQTVVSSDGLHEVILLETFEDADYLVGSFCSSWALEFTEPHLSGLPIVQREDMLGTRCSDNRINFVIAHAVVCVSGYRASLRSDTDHTLSRKDPGGSLQRAFLPEGLPAARVQGENVLRRLTDAGLCLPCPHLHGVRLRAARG